MASKRIVFGVDAREKIRKGVDILSRCSKSNSRAPWTQRCI